MPLGQLRPVGNAMAALAPSRRLALAVIAALAGVVACEKPEIEWGAERRVAGAMLPGSTLVLLEGSVPAMRPAWNPVRWPEDSLACDGTRIGARTRGDTVRALWWTRSTGGEARLVTSRSDNGGIDWDVADTVGRAPVTRDPRDTCRRPPPGLGVDSVSGATFAVYHGAAAGHEGVLLARFPATGAPFAAPTLIAEGGSIGVASVASVGDTVAVAFESPSADDTGVWLAISSVRGDIPVIRLMVSAAGIRAFAPAVAIRDGQVGVAWNEARRGDAGRTAVARVGRFARQ